jgi:flavin reductase (DIM6/NTAB) family NADH-FMN oxidoreductase RutF
MVIRNAAAMNNSFHLSQLLILSIWKTFHIYLIIEENGRFLASITHKTQAIGRACYHATALRLQ